MSSSGDGTRSHQRSGGATRRTPERKRRASATRWRGDGGERCDMEAVCGRMRPLRMSFEASGRAHHVKLRKLSSPETKDHVARTKHQLAKSEMRRGPFASAPGQALPPSPCPHVLRRRPLRAPSTCSALVIVCSPCSGAANPSGAVPWHLCWHRVLPPPPLASGWPPLPPCIRCVSPSSPRLSMHPPRAHVALLFQSTAARHVPR